MSRIFVPAAAAEDWKRLLAEPEKHWRTGYSAKALAHCWQSADGFPDEIRDLFANSSFAQFSKMEPLLAFPEFIVQLPGGRRGSHNDLFVVAKDAEDQLVSMTVEGKVSETFGRTLAEWNAEATQGKRQRFAYILSQLGLKMPLPDTIRYQLLHRTASAVIMARRFNAQSAVMIVHSFSQSYDGLDDYQHFLALFGAKGVPEQLVRIARIDGIWLFCGWVTGNRTFLNM